MAKNGDLINGFRHAYRFANDSKGIKMSEIIKFKFLNPQDYTDSLWYLNIEENIDTIFDGVRTSTYNIGTAIERIIESCNENLNIGAIDVKAFKSKNRVYLQIINKNFVVHEYDSKDFLINRMGGTTNTFERLLRDTVILILLQHLKTVNIISFKSYQIRKNP